MHLTWVIDPPRQPTCDNPRASTGKVLCELPWDHIIGGVNGPQKVDWHTGRNARGAWLTWT